MPIPIDRREFVASASAGAIAAITASSSCSQTKAPSDRLRLGLIGCGERGRRLIEVFARYPDVDIPVLADVIEPRMAQAAEILTTVFSRPQPDQLIDYREILDRADIDAVVIATPDHWHARPFLHACQAGKHVFVEKPLSLTVAEGRAMVNAARKSGIIALAGTQQRAGAHYRKAVEMIQAGRLGKIGLVETWNYSDRGARAGQSPDAEPPPGYHWDQWLGQAPYAPFNESRLIYKWWFDYSGGSIANWCAHHFDIVLWAIGNPSPRSVSASGGKFVVDDLADTYDTVEATLEFDTFLLSHAHRAFNPFHLVRQRPWHHGICFYGSDATLLIDRYGYELYANHSSSPHEVHQFPVEPPVETMEGVPYISVPAFLKRKWHDRQIDPDGAQEGQYHRQFLDCVKSGRPAPVPLEDSHRVANWCHLANIAYRTKRRIHWDDSREQILGDAEAAAMLSRLQRPGYELPAV